ncbi:bifunctional adenosylcobinamide kinase/adenosylcobinamide-phosphate guanylyltransferase, partial [Ruminococcus sp.]
PWLEKWKNAVVISQEVGCGLVPVEPEQRRFREAVGRLNCLLAESAETVERVCCGLGMRLK